MRLKKKAVTLMLPEHIHEAGQTKADTLGLNFGGYVSSLIYADNRERLEAYINQELTPGKAKTQPRIPNKPAATVTDRVQVRIDDTSEYISVDEAVAIIGMAKRTVQQKLQRGELQGYKGHGNIWNVSRAAAERFKK